MDLSFVIIFVLNCNSMSVFLILTPDRTFVYPFTVVLTQPIEVYPESSWTIRDDSLWTIQVDGDLVIFVFNIGECSSWIGVTIDIIKLFLGEKGLIVLMFEQFTSNSQPSIGVSYKFVLIVNRTSDLEIEILHVIALRCSDSLDFPFVGSRVGDADQGCHFVSFPLD